MRASTDTWSPATPTIATTSRSAAISAARELLERHAAVVEVKVGKGRVILIGFRPQHRAQPHRTFKLLFNALFLAGVEETEL